MYSCSSKESPDYMSDKILKKIKRQVRFLQSLSIPVVINLIGGEPTLNINKFEHIFNIVSTWGVGIMISTNGWWLRSNELTDRFFLILSPHIREDGISTSKINGQPFIIRVSDDKYHKLEREKRGNPDPNIVLPEYIKAKNIISPDKNPFIFVQDGYVESYVVYPNGRGKDVSDLDRVYQKFNVSGSCCMFDLYDTYKPGNIHYNPQGLIEDGCMYGSYYDVGTVNDNILFSLLMITLYKNDRSTSDKLYNCFNCRDMFQEWKKDNLDKYRLKYARLNRFNREIWDEFPQR